MRLGKMTRGAREQVTASGKDSQLPAARSYYNARTGINAREMRKKKMSAVDQLDEVMVGGFG